MGPIKLQTQHEQHYEFEPYAVVARWVGATTPSLQPGVSSPGAVQLQIWSSDQYAHSERSSLANYFGLPINSIILSTALGGTEGGAVLGMALGDKTSGEALAVTSALARKAGAGVAVKMVLTRANQAVWMSARFPITGYMTMGAMKDGTFTAIKAQLYVNSGAYGGSQGSDAISDIYGTYAVPNVTIDGVSANTNRYHTSGSMRDVGESQGHFIIESAVDQLAQALGMDPAAFRLKNIRQAAVDSNGNYSLDPKTKYPLDAKGNLVVDPSTLFPYTSIGQPNAFNKAAASFNWSSRWKGWGKASQVNGVLRRGIGVASLHGNKGSVGSPSTGQIQVNPDGSVIAYTGLTDHGAGGNTTFAILAAESLGLTSLASISMVQCDTSLTTDSGVTAGSRSTAVAGQAFIAAATDLMRQWGPLVAAKLAPGTDPTKLKFGNNQIFDSTNPSNAMAFTDAAKLLPTAGLKGSGTYTPPAGITQRVAGTKFAEVEVNTETGEVRVVSYTSSIGIGRVVFPKGAESQVRGGLFMGIGETFYQELWVDPTTGRHLNPNFHDFKIPTIMEVPDSVTTLWEEQNDPVGPFGAKGLGELALMAVSPLLTNALSNALGGYRFNTLPVSRADVIAAIQWCKQNGVF